MSSEFRGLLQAGIGDLLIIKAQLDFLKDTYETIYVSPNKKLVNTYRAECEDSYISFLFELFNLLFSEPYYRITDDQSYQEIHPDAFSEYPAVQPNLSKLLCNFEEESEIEEPYFVLTTKVREYQRREFEKYKQDIIRILNKVSKKIRPVLLGERHIGMNKEYRIHGSGSVYSLYEDYRNNLDCLDLTFEEAGLKAPNLASVLKDATRMNRARFVFSVGGGGQLVLAMSVGRAIGCGEYDYKIIQGILNNKPRDLLLTTDMKKIEERMEEYSI
jgi:hypothetical protein